MSETHEPPGDLVFDHAVLLGVLAHGTRVSRGRDEFTIDFLRDIPESSRPVLVARALARLS